MVKCLCHVWELRLSLLLYWVLSDWIYDIGMQKTWIFVLEKGTSSIVCCVKIPTKRKKNSEPDFLKLYLVNQNNYHSIKQKLECYRCSTTTGASNAKEEGWAIQLSFAFHNTETSFLQIAIKFSVLLNYLPEPLKNYIWPLCKYRTAQSLRNRVIDFNCFLQGLYETQTSWILDTVVPNYRN